MMAGLADNATVSIKTSPTFVSTNLLTPHQIDRLTIPSIGTNKVRVRPIGGHTWGENLTNYGGIGKLPFLGKTRARDLYVTRSLKHFGSGFSLYETDVQPSQVTTLRKSACRVNDQLIPSPIKAEIKPWRYLLDLSEPGHDRTPYFSHKSIFEVFPRNDPCRRNKSGEPELNKMTREALCGIHRRIYHLPRYSSVFPHHKEYLLNQANYPQFKPEGPENSLYTLSTEKARDATPEEENKSCNQCKEVIEVMKMSLQPLMDVLSRAGEAVLTFTAKDALSLVFQYHGEEAVENIVEITKHSFKLFKSCDCNTENELSSLGVFINTAIFPMVEGLAKIDGNIFDVLKGKIPDPSVKAEDRDRTEKVVDARHQCQTLRSFIVGTNITSFDRAIIADLYSTDESRKKQRIKGIAPLWPPSRYYVLNNQRMKLQSIGSFPTNFRYQSELPTFEELEAMEKEEEEKDEKKEEVKEQEMSDEKHVRFSDTVITHNAESYEYGPEEGESRPKCVDAYDKYLDKILPVLREENKGEVSQRYIETAGGEVYGEEKKEEIPKYEALDPLLACRYPPSHPTAIRGDWRTRSIVDPNQHLKTWAQRRYHELYPAPIPDLRDNHRFSKKYSFSGYHTSTFRG